MAVFTTKQVFHSGEPILHVTHDADNGAWQFHTGSPAHTADMMVVALEEVLAHDRTIAELADLPLGWFAERVSVDQSWVRHPQPLPNRHSDELRGTAESAR